MAKKRGKKPKESLGDILLGEEEIVISPSIPPRMGRPPAFSDVKDFEDRAYAYLDECKILNRLPNKAMLAFHLGVVKSTLYEYEKKEDFSNALKSIYALIEDEWVQRLGKAHAAGSIFYLKNAFEYRDSVDHTTDGKPINFTVPQEIAAKHSLVFIEGKKEDANNV